MWKLTALALLISFTCYADPSPSPSPVTCNQVIQACDKALEAKEKQLQLSDLALKQALDDRGKLQKDLESTRADKDAWYRNPGLWIAVGILVGGAVVIGGGVAIKQASK